MLKSLFPVLLPYAILLDCSPKLLSAMNEKLKPAFLIAGSAKINPIKLARQGEAYERAHHKAFLPK